MALNAIENVHRQAGRKLEATTLGQLEERGFLGLSSVHSKSLKSPEGSAIPIPPEVGEIDVLCIHPEKRLLVVAECKNVLFAYNPALWNDDNSDFVRKKMSYRAKFLRKIDWVLSNAPQLIAALATRFHVPSAGDWSIAPVMVTACETLAAQFIDDFDCLSLPVLLKLYDDQEDWPLPVQTLSL